MLLMQQQPRLRVGFPARHRCPLLIPAYSSDLLSPWPRCQTPVKRFAPPKRELSSTSWLHRLDPMREKRRTPSDGDRLPGSCSFASALSSCGIVLECFPTAIGRPARNKAAWFSLSAACVADSGLAHTTLPCANIHQATADGMRKK
jgi:hypothetical protein